MRGRTIWVLSHCEYHLSPRDGFVDETPLYVASSRKNAERLIRTAWVEPGTWWRSECFRLDDPEGELGGWVFYSRAGRLIASPPYKQGLRSAIARYARQVTMLRKWIRDARREGRPEKEIRNLRESRDSVRAVVRSWKRRERKGMV